MYIRLLFCEIAFSARSCVIQCFWSIFNTPFSQFHCSLKDIDIVRLKNYRMGESSSASSVFMQSSFSGSPYKRGRMVDRFAIQLGSRILKCLRDVVIVTLSCRSVGIWNRGQSARRSSICASPLSGLVDGIGTCWNLGKINWENSVFTLVLCLWVKSSYPPQTREPRSRRWAPRPRVAMVYAS